MKEKTTLEEATKIYADYMIAKAEAKFRWEERMKIEGEEE